MDSPLNLQRIRHIIGEELGFILPVGHCADAGSVGESGGSSLDGGRVSASQAECCEFESRRLEYSCSNLKVWGNKLSTLDIQGQLVNLLPTT